MTEPAELTRRELEVLRQAARGLTRSESGTETRHSEETIHEHRKHLFSKLGARTIGHAVAIGYELGLIQTGEPRTPGEHLTAWQQLDEREQVLFEDWLARVIDDEEYVIRWREVDEEFAALASRGDTRAERLRRSLRVEN